MTSNWKNKVVSNFDRKAQNYDRYADIQKNIAALQANDLPDAAQDILEVGCGSGALTLHLAEKYADRNIHVTDISPAMLNLAQENSSNQKIRWSILDGETENTGEKYDLIVANMALHWFENIEKGIENLLSMLKAEGTLFFTLPGPRNFHEWQATLTVFEIPCGILESRIPEGVYRRHEIHQTIPDAYNFFKSLKEMGASSSSPTYTPLNSGILRRAMRSFDKAEFTGITWDILFIRRKKERFLK